MVRKGKGHKKRRQPGKMALPRPANTFDQFIEEVQVTLGTKKNPPGRPTVKPNILLGRRDDIAYLFEEEWRHIGWQLQCLRNRTKQPRSPDDVRDALKPLEGKHYHERIAILLRETSAPATSEEVRSTFARLGEARKKLDSIRNAHQEQVTNFKDVWRALYETSEKYRQELKLEITRRIANIVQLRNECSEKEELKRNAETQARPQVELMAAQAQLEKSQDALRVEEEIVRGLKERLGMANAQNRSAVREMVKTRVQQLRKTKTEFQYLTGEVQRLETLYLDQAAGFARQDFLTFSVEKRGRHHPRQLANAIAGLPEMGCRQSYATCRKIPFQRDPQPNFKVFEFIARVWKQRYSTADFADLVKKELNRVPKTWLFNGERVPYYFREYLSNNQPNLVTAIQSCQQLRPRPHPGEIPYMATTRFLDNISKQQTSTLARVLSQSARAK
jgi:uncharacterized protein (DUF2267 family)